MKIAIISSQLINKLPNSKLAYIERELITEDGLNFNQFLITDRLVTFSGETYLDENEVEQTRIVREFIKDEDCTIRSRKRFVYDDTKVIQIKNVVNSVYGLNLDPLEDKQELFLKAMILESNNSNNGLGLYGCTNWLDVNDPNFIPII